MSDYLTTREGAEQQRLTPAEAVRLVTDHYTEWMQHQLLEPGSSIARDYAEGNIKDVDYFNRLQPNLMGIVNTRDTSGHETYKPEEQRFTFADGVIPNDNARDLIGSDFANRAREAIEKKIRTGKLTAQVRHDLGENVVLVANVANVANLGENPNYQVSGTQIEVPVKAETGWSQQKLLEESMKLAQSTLETRQQVLNTGADIEKQFQGR